MAHDQPADALGPVLRGPAELVGREQSLLQRAVHRLHYDAWIRPRLAASTIVRARGDALAEALHDLARPERPRSCEDLHAAEARLFFAFLAMSMEQTHGRHKM